MPYKISGNLSESTRIIVVKESDWSIESNTTETGESYEIDPVVSGIKTIIARKSDGECQAYGGVEPEYYEEQSGGSLEVSISSDNDDGYFWSGNSNITGRDEIMFGAILGYGPAYTFLKFNNINIPQGSTITEAKFTGTTTNDRMHADYLNGVVSVDIYGNDEDDASAPTNWSQYQSLSKTSASVVWNFPAETWPDNEERVSPDIKTIIQEIVDRPGWESGNSIMIMVECDDDWGYENKEFASYSDSYDPFEISITYE